MKYTASLAFARDLDHRDPLGKFREEFFIPDAAMIYLDGNSLGRLPRATVERTEHLVKNEWGERLIRSWNEGWYDRAQTIGSALARLIGASADEVILADSTSVNLYKLTMAALEYQKGRNKIVSDEFNFPTDIHIVESAARKMGTGYATVLIKSSDGIHITQGELMDHLTEEVALLVLSHVAYKSGFMYDMEEVTRIAHEKGILVLWDLSHSAGSVPVDLNSANADLAVGCTYKYLNGGPGSPAFLFVKKELQDVLRSPIEGWFGDSDPFSFKTVHEPAEGIRKFLTGTPPVLSLSAIEPGVSLLLSAGMEQVRKKSIEQTGFLVFLAERMLAEHGFKIGSPPEAKKRGSHVALRHPEAWRICQALTGPAEGKPVVIPDFRDPDVIRLGVAPLYTMYADLYLAIERISEIMRTEEFKRFKTERSGVT